MSVRKAQFPAQVWDGTAADRDSRLLEINPLHPSYDQVVAELIATQQYARALVNVTESYSADAGDNLTKGQPVYIDGSGRLQTAESGMVAGAQVAGLAANDAAALASADYITDGFLEMSDWTAITGSNELTPGAVYYLGTTPGTLTTIAPTADGYYVVRVGRAQSVTKLDIEIGQPIRL